MKTKIVIISILISLLAASCREKDIVASPEEENDYFPLNQFLIDQVKYKGHNPYSFTKIVRVNDKEESSLVSVDDIDWVSLLATFAEGDISGEAYTGKYEAQYIDDSRNGFRTVTYTAKEADLPVRQLNIGLSPYSDKIISLYIEYEKNSWGSTIQKKMLYEVDRVIQVQEYKKTLFSDVQSLMVTYRFND